MPQSFQSVGVQGPVVGGMRGVFQKEAVRRLSVKIKEGSGMECGTETNPNLHCRCDNILALELLSMIDSV